MEVRRFSNDEGDRTNGLYTRDGDRLGFTQRRNTEDGTRYGIGIDHMGSPYRGALDRELSTPLGTIDYGYDGDTVAAGFTPNNPYVALLQRIMNTQTQPQIQPQGQSSNSYYIQALANLLSR